MSLNVEESLSKIIATNINNVVNHKRMIYCPYCNNNIIVTDMSTYEIIEQTISNHFTNCKAK